MDFFAIFEWYEANAYIVTPLTISIFCLGLSLGIFQVIGDRFLRLGLLLPIGAVLLVLSFGTGPYANELYLNLSMQVFLTLAAVLILGIATQFEGWFGPTLVVAFIAILLQFFIPADNIGSNVPLTLSTGLVGALMITFMIRQEWSWSPVKKERRLSAAMRKAKKVQAEAEAQMGDFFILIPGGDESAIQQKIDFLAKHDLAVSADQPAEFDEETETYYRLVSAKIETVVKDREAVFLQNREARIQVFGFPDTTKRVYKQISEVLPTREQKRISDPHDNMLHIEFKTDAPSQLYSAVLEEKLYQLARQWQYGDDPALQQATANLLEWAQAQGLVQK